MLRSIQLQCSFFRKVWFCLIQRFLRKRLKWEKCTDDNTCTSLRARWTSQIIFSRNINKLSRCNLKQHGINTCKLIKLKTYPVNHYEVVDFVFLFLVIADYWRCLNLGSNMLKLPTQVEPYNQKSFYITTDTCKYLPVIRSQLWYDS